jgi:phosphonate transport system permease protein
MKKKTLYSYLGVLLLVALLVWSYYGTEASFFQLLGADSRHQVVEFVKQLFPPDISPEMIKESLSKAMETLAMSFLGTILAVILSVPLAFLSTSTLNFTGILYEFEQSRGIRRKLRQGIYHLATLILNFLRSIPEILWALIFILAVGLGPFPGVLALGVHTAGVLGKLYSEILEDVDAGPIEALQSTGASRSKIFFYSIMPNALPQCLSYTLYRWEVNIRAATIVGVVGAGGLGREIYVAISLFHYSQLLTLLIMVFAIVTLVDYLSALIRFRLI